MDVTASISISSSMSSADVIPYAYVSGNASIDSATTIVDMIVSGVLFALCKIESNLIESTFGIIQYMSSLMITFSILSDADITPDALGIVDRPGYKSLTPKRSYYSHTI